MAALADPEIDVQIHSFVSNEPDVLLKFSIGFASQFSGFF